MKHGACMLPCTCRRLGSRSRSRHVGSAFVCESKLGIHVPRVASTCVLAAAHPLGASGCSGGAGSCICHRHPRRCRPHVQAPWAGAMHVPSAHTRAHLHAGASCHAHTRAHTLAHAHTGNAGAHERERACSCAVCARMPAQCARACLR
eukprot:5679222-Pleurochrysis_carterae.AAC.1